VKWISTARLAMALGFACMASQAMAQQGATAQSFDELSARLEQQDKQIQQLQAQVSGMQQGVNATPVAFALGGAPAAAAAAPAGPQCCEVGSDMSCKVRWYNGAGLMFESPNKDFTMHLGGWMQWDNVSWNQNKLNEPAAAGGIGPLNDGDYWRRLRIVMEGTFWETFEYRWNYAFEKQEFDTVGLDEFWIGVNKIPVIGTIRAGHVKTPMGLEGDMTSSSRCMTFMERSSYSTAIELNQNFCNGLWFGNSFCDDRGTYSAAVFRPDLSGNGDFFNTGEVGAQARFTALPLYEDDGRHLLHLGLSGGWRNGNVAGGTAAVANSVTLSATPEMNDNSPPGSTGAQPGGISPTMITTGTIVCSDDYLLGTELLYIRGPLSLQAEYGWNFVANGQVGTNPTSSYIFNGGYLMASYMLTGENRAYDKKSGSLSRYYLGGQGPYENAFMVRDEDGCICAGHGAVELACRYSYTNLNSGSGTAAINGGIMDGLGLALNWYLNSNVVIMNDWNYNYRYDMPAGKNAGSTNGIGTEIQLSF